MTGEGVWVTGVGAISAAGLGAPALLDALAAGRGGIRPASPDADGPGPAGRPPLPAAPCPDPPRDPETRRLDRTAALFHAAAVEAWEDAGLPDAAPEPARAGVFEGSSLGPMAGLLDEARAAAAARSEGAPGRERRPRPSALLRYLIGAGGALFAQRRGIDGPVLHLSAASVSGACAIGEAAEAIRSGRLDVAVAGAAECPLQSAISDAFEAAGILSPRDCRPFDARRSGTVLGEGAGVLVLESETRARARGARPRARLVGYGLAVEAGSMVAPEPGGRGVAAAAVRALRGARAGAPGWIKAHGTATRCNDAAECRGLAALLGDALTTAPLVGLKATLGHTLGASGALEAAAAVLALEAGLLPGTLGTDLPDPELPPCSVSARPRERAARTALLLAASFGGRCTALVVARAA
ncbi:MAG: beta-ketoacyl synthase N-terminal-like domain-containing protein [Gemmatimonadota bacterium]